MSEKQEKKTKPVRLVVTSDKMAKSRVGTIEHTYKHPRYGKYMRRRTKLMFHDEKNETKVGDEVLVTSSRPLSARKKFTLLQIVRKAAE